MTIGATTMPLEVAIVAGGLIIGAGFLLWPVLSTLDDVVNALKSSARLGMYLVFILLLIAGTGVGLAYLAVRIVQRDRVARGMTYIVGAAVVLGVIVADRRSGSMITVAFAVAVALFFLGFSDPARAWFTGAGAPQSGVPVWVVVGCTTAFAMAFVVLCAGGALLSLPYGNNEVQGLLLLVVGALTLATARGVQAGNQQGRLILSGLMVLAIILTLANNDRALGVLIVLGLAGGVLYSLWGPPESRAYFDQQPQAPSPPAAW